MKRVLLLSILLLAPGVAQAQTSDKAPVLPGKVAVAQKLGAQVPLDLTFHNEQDQVVKLRQLFRGKPVLLNFVYFNCPMLCPMTLEGTASSLSELKFSVGKEFDVITVSIDPRDKARVAAQKKDKYVKRYGRLDAANGWHFLTGTETPIRKLTEAVGFQYAYEARTDQFAHASMMLVLTPDGRTSRYLPGFQYKPRDLRLAIVEASGGKIGNAADQLLLLCFHYDPSVGKYSRNALNLVRAGGLTGLAFIASFIVVMIRREKHSGGNH